MGPNYRLQATIARQQLTKELNKQVFYYTINQGENGGVVIASNIKEATRKLNAKYGDKDIEVWIYNEDPAWDSQFADVHERY